MIDVAFDLALAHGRCVGVRLPTDDAEVAALARHALADEERAYSESLPALRRRTWVGGRAALRRALEREGCSAPGSILPDARGAPLLPEGIAGSISHKESLAVALVLDKSGARVGVDLEMDRAPRTDIARHVLRDEELREVSMLGAEERVREVLLRFSAKEAIYKALDPYVRRYVAFQEVRVTPQEGGSALVSAHLRPGEGPFMIQLAWRRTGGMILTTALVRPLASP